MALSETRGEDLPLSTARLLLVDDDREIRDLVSHFLEKHGYVVETVRDGREMNMALQRNDVDLVILDIMLPGKDGLELCREIRERSHVPIMMLTAMGEETDRIVGLEMGADDYLAKPFSPRELLARVRALLRRVNFLKIPAGAVANGRVLHFAGWTLDLARRRLTAPDGMLVGLTSGEFEMLVAFAEHPHQVLSRDQLLDLTRGRDSSPFDRSVDVQVSRLRRKIEPQPAEPRLIQTVRGGGYIFSAVVEANGGEPCA
jgi:two-component system, OmpR family, response regulator